MKRLLIVEHNHLFRDGLALLLKWRTGLVSVCARSLTEAKSILDDENQMPVCVIVDLDLPDEGGTELLKHLNGLPVLALIKSRNMERQAEAIGLGATQVLRSTGPPEKIVAAVEQLIGPRHITTF